MPRPEYVLRRAGAVVTGFGVLAALSLSSCSGEPKFAPPTPRPTTPTVSSVVLAGPSSVAPGATAQFTLVAQISDGTQRDVTGLAVWTTTNSGVVTVASGLASGRTVGEATLTARYTPTGQPALARSASIVVLADGTFRVLARVTEPGGFPVPNASVTILSGPGTGQRRFSGGDGRVRFYGLAGPTRIEATKAGYRDDSQEVSVTTPDQSFEFELRPPTSIADLNGPYTLTVGASPLCRDNLPEESRIRTYTANLTSNGRDVTISLGGATFYGSNNRFTGRVEPTGLASFLIGYFYYYYYGPYGGIVEQLGPNRLWVSGTVTASLSGNLVAGELNGLFDLRTSDRNQRVAFCSARDHQFQLRR